MRAVERNTTRGNTFFAICLLLSAFVWNGCSSNHTTADSEPRNASVTKDRVVKQPGEVGEEGKIYVVRDGQRHWIMHSSWIGAHASELTSVQTISPSELTAIPLGDPITAER